MKMEKYGRGRETDAEGNTFTGDFEDGMRHGWGRQTDAGGNDTYIGYFKNGVRHGNGHYDSKGFRYAGEWKDGKVVGVLVSEELLPNQPEKKPCCEGPKPKVQDPEVASDIPLIQTL